MTSPLALVPRAIQVCWLIESLMNRELPSAIITFTPPGWALWALENSESSGPQPPHESRHEFQGNCLELGVTTVLNRVMLIAPQPQRFPTVPVMLLPDWYAVVHAFNAGRSTV